MGGTSLNREPRTPSSTVNSSQATSSTVNSSPATSSREIDQAQQIRRPLVLKLSTRDAIGQSRQPRLRISSTMNTTHLPGGTLLDSTNFIPWKARVDNALCALGLSTVDAQKPSNTWAEEWQALSELAARTIHDLVPASLLKQIVTGNYYDHAKLGKDLEGLTLRFRFLDLPPELRNRVYEYVIPIETVVRHGPVQDVDKGFPSITSVSRQIREESLPLAYHRCAFFLDFRPSADIGPDEKFPSERVPSVPECARKWARGLSGPHKKLIHYVRLIVPSQRKRDASRYSFRAVSFCLRSERLRASASRSHSYRLTGSSRQLMCAYSQKVEEERQLLHLQGEALIMALTRDDENWKYGTLKCK